MHFFLCFIRILFEKLMIQKFPYIYSLKRILLQAFIEEVPRLSRDVNIRWNLYFIFYNLDKFLFLGNFEGVLTNEHLIHHNSLIKIEHTERPDINLFVILFTSENLRTNIKWSSTKSGSHFIVLMHTPSKIAQFNDILF